MGYDGIHQPTNRGHHPANLAKKILIIPGGSRNQPRLNHRVNPTSSLGHQENVWKCHKNHGQSLTFTPWKNTKDLSYQSSPLLFEDWLETINPSAEQQHPFLFLSSRHANVWSDWPNVLLGQPGFNKGGPGYSSTCYNSSRHRQWFNDVLSGQNTEGSLVYHLASFTYLLGNHEKSLLASSGFKPLQGQDVESTLHHTICRICFVFFHQYMHVSTNIIIIYIYVYIYICIHICIYIYVRTYV